MSHKLQINSVKAFSGSFMPSVKKGGELRKFGIVFAVSLTVLIVFGLIVVYSAVSKNPEYSFSRQLVGVVAGLAAPFAIRLVDYKKFSNLSLIFLVISVVLILMPALPVIGVEAKGARSWISIFGMQIQPGEFAKITVILMSASLVSKFGGKIDDIHDYIKLVGVLLIPFVCIMTQPDLGTGLVYLFIGGTALVVGGARLKFLLITLAIGLAGIIAIFAIDQMIYVTSGEYVLLKEYQRSRLLVFIDPTYSTSSDGYNLAQALIAIGSGGIFGKGLFNSTQSTLGFLPEAPTDFIFCVLAEELGFVGVVFLLVLYIVFLLSCLKIAYNANDAFGTLIVVCIVGMWIFHILENIGMTCSLMPITGIPLPFISFGSSFMIVNLILVGMILSVVKHSDK